MADRSTASSIDEYLAGFPLETRKALEEMRALIRASAPGATETVAYSMPTFDLNGRHLVHFAGFARHVGFYPIPSGIEAFKEEFAPCKQGKGSVQFPLGQPLPADLIRGSSSSGSRRTPGSGGSRGAGRPSGARAARRTRRKSLDPVVWLLEGLGGEADRRRDTP